MATHTEKLFGGALQGGRVPDRASLQKIADDLLSFAQVDKADRNQNPLQDAVVVEKDCPAGLIGCDAAELSKKTGGLLSCPPLSVAPDPLIVDYKGRLCYAPEDIRREFEGKELNVDSLIDKYSRKLLKYLESGSNLRVAVDVAQRGPKGNPLVLNAYRNSANLVAALTTLYNGVAPSNDQLAEVSALLSKFTDKLVPSSGAELVNYIMNAPGNPLDSSTFGGAGGIHQRLTYLIVVGVIATSNDNGKSSRLAKLLNTLGEVLVFGEAGFVGGNDAATAALNAVSFLPLSFRQGLGIAAAPSSNGSVLLYRFVVFSLVVSIGEILDSAIPELYCSAITGLRIAFNEMRVKRDAVEQYMKRKVDGVTTGSTGEEMKLLEAKKGGDRLYVARIVFFSKVCLARLGYKFADGFPALPATDSQNYYEQAVLALSKPLPAAGTARLGMEALVKFALGVLQATGFNLISLPGAYRTFFSQALTYSKSTAFSVPEDPEIFPQQLASSSPTDKAGLTAALAADSAVLGPGAGPVCKSYVDGVPVFLGTSISPAGAADAGVIAVKQGLAKAVYNNGSAPDLARVINSLSAAEVRGILVRNCFPITEPSDANVRLHYTLSRGKPTDDVFASVFGVVDPEVYKARGLLAADRDLYVKFLIVMAWVGNAQVAAQLLYGQNMGVFAATLRSFAAEKKVPTGTRLGGGDEEIDGGEIDIDAAADFFLSGGQVIVPAHQMPDGLAKYLDKYDVDRREGKEIRELQEKLEKRGFGISFIPTGSKCPSYARDSGNTFGAPGHKNWVETKSAWPKCMELMGVQFVTDKGYCYPYGMSCYKEDDVITTTEKTEGKVANWNVLAEIVQEVQQKRYQEWLQGELDRINKDAINANMTEEQKKELAMSFMPAEFKDMPDKASMLSLSVISSELAASVNEFTTSNDPAQLARLREILRNGYLQDEWYDSNVSVRNQAIDDKAKELLDQVKVCTDADTKKDKPLECDEQNFPDPHDPSKTIKVFIPKQINKEINEEALKRGEDPAAILKWWQEYYANRVVEKQKKQMEVAEKLSPFKLPSNLVYKAQDIEAAKHRQLSEQGKFEHLLDAALHKKGEKGYDIASRYSK